LAGEYNNIKNKFNSTIVMTVAIPHCTKSDLLKP